MEELSKETIQLASQGDLTAFKEIYSQMSGFVYNVACRALNNREDAQEVTQDVFVTLYRKLATFRFESSLKTWVYRITYNLTVNRLKKRNKEQDRTISYEDAIQTPGLEENFKKSQDMSFASDQEKLIHNMLNILNEDQRTCMILRHLEGLDYQEIAAVLKININTVRTRLKRAREKLIAYRNEGAKNEL